jgi:protein TonB
MKSFVLTFFFLGFSIAKAQDKNQFFALDAQMNQTVLDSSKYILWIHETDSVKWQWDYYYSWGALVKSTIYADHDGTIKNGRFCIYNSFGNLDSTGIYKEGKKNGSFLKFRSITKDSTEMLSQYEYEEDSLVSFRNFKDEKTKVTRSDTSGNTEPEYPGGPSKWIRYLVHSLRYPERAVDKEIQGVVKICFQIDTAGNTTDYFIFKSVEYSVDQESIRLIENSGKWIPGKKGGEPVTTFKTEAINYKLESQ